MKKGQCRKRPCCICHKWFTPDIRQQGRQKTCCKACRKEYRRRECSQWNRKNKPYQKANYLSAKLEQVPRTENAGQTIIAEPKQQLPPSRLNLDLPREVICQEIGFVQLIVWEYIVEQISRRISKWANRSSKKKYEPG